MPRRLAAALLVLLTVVVTPAAGAEDAFFWVPLTKLQLDGPLPADGGRQDWGGRAPWDVYHPYAILDGQGEAFLAPADASPNPWVAATGAKAALLVRAPRAGDVVGTVFLPDAKADRLVPRRFTLPASAATADARDAFYLGKQWHYERLLALGVPGGAWFRHQVQMAEQARNPGGIPTANRRERGPNRPAALEETYALFSGGRVLSENLQLDRVLPAREAAREGQVVALDSIRGIETKEMDWKAKLDAAGKDAERDPLAKLIPDDQHALFFPTFDAMVALADEADRYGTLALHAVEPRSEDAGTRRRYERQLCLSLTGLGRLIGPHVVKSVAVTGSDPYLRVGSDVAVLFEPAGDVAALEKLLLAQVAAVRAASPAAKGVTGEVAGVPFTGAVSPDRSISSYVAAVGPAVVVTNSKAQLERLAAVHQGKAPAIDSLDEYAFFRARYRRGQDDESALLLLTDATIRRWCGPRWRIADSRRTRVAALLADLQAQHLDTLAKGDVRPDNRPHIDLFVADMGELRVTPTGVTSSAYGSLAFMTPILELPVEQVSGAEARAYGRWRDTYESNWRQYFDPIAVRLSMRKDGSVAGDMTVMPLIQNSTYRPLISVTRDAVLPAAAGDPHGEALTHLALGINPKSPTVTLGAAFLAGVLPGDKEDLLSSLGGAVALYADDDPFWAEAAKAGGASPLNYLFDHLDRAPVAIHIELKDGEAMTRYLVAAQQWAQESYPDWTRWETLEHAGQQYVKITRGPKAPAQHRAAKDGALCYANTGKALILTPREDLLRRAIDRGKAGAPAGAAQWLGESAGLRVHPRAWEVLRQGMGQSYRQVMRRRAWDNLPILNEWKRRYPDADPVALHERLWHARLLDGSGGSYVWNEKLRSMESTTYGHPAAPKDGPEAPAELSALLAAHFGLTFEEDGLRAKGMVERKK